jgi:hypothetical protein
MPDGSATQEVFAPRTWQDQYAAPDWRKRLVTLDPEAEQQFQVWAKSNNVPITDDYDMRAFWKALSGGDPRARTAINPNDHALHFPDTFKTLLHQSFSGESIYANPASKPPKWNQRDQLVDARGRVIFDERERR